VVSFGSNGSRSYSLNPDIYVLAVLGDLYLGGPCFLVSEFPVSNWEGVHMLLLLAPRPPGPQWRFPPLFSLRRLEGAAGAPLGPLFWYRCCPFIQTGVTRRWSSLFPRPAHFYIFFDMKFSIAICIAAFFPPFCPGPFFFFSPTGIFAVLNSFHRTPSPPLSFLWK